MKSIKILLKSFFLILFFLSSHSFSDILNKIEIIGNDRISDETIKLFIKVELKDEINDVKLNEILKDLYETNFFENVNIKFLNNILKISVSEHPIIQKVIYEGIKSKSLLGKIKENKLIREKASFNEFIAPLISPDSSCFFACLIKFIFLISKHWFS